MSIYEKYELVDVLGDDGVKTFAAKEIATGRPVQIHLLVGQPGKSEPPFELLDKMRQMPESQKTHVLETGEHLGTPFVVTKPLDGFANFREWVRVKSLPPAQPSGTMSAAALSRVGVWKIPPGFTETGEKPIAREAAPLPVTARPPAPKPHAPPLPPSRQDSAVSDITQMFNTAEVLIPKRPAAATPPAASAPSAPPAPVIPPVPAAGSSGAPREDDFAKLFLKPGAAESPAESVIPKQAELPASEFTQMFQPPSPGATGQMPAASPGPAPVTPIKTEPDQVGEFTRMFQAPAGSVSGQMKAAPTPPTATPAAKTNPPEGDAPSVTASKPGEFTQMFQAPASGSTAQIPAGGKPLDKPHDYTLALTRESSKGGVEPSAGGPGPGQFTKMFQNPPASPPAEAKTSAAPPGKPPGEFTQMFEAASRAAGAGQESKEPKDENLPSTKQIRASPPAPATERPAGEFTQMFQPPMPSASAQMKAVEPKSPAGAAKPPEPPPPNSAPGEFTQMFQTSHASAMKPGASAPPAQTSFDAPAKTPVSAEDRPAGEFTRLFSTSPGQPLGEPPTEKSSGSQAPTPPAPAPAPGSITALFATPSIPKQPLPIAGSGHAQGADPNPFAPPSSPLVKPMIAPNPAQSGSPSPFGGPSAFGQPPQAPSPFGPAPAGVIPQRPYAAPAQPSVQDEYHKMFGGGPAGAPQAGPAGPGGPQGNILSGATASFQAMQSPPGPAAAGQSEFTRMFQQPLPAPATPQPAAAPQVPQPRMSLPPLPKKQTPKWPLFAIGGLILIVLIGLIVTFVRK